MPRRPACDARTSAIADHARHDAPIRPFDPRRDRHCRRRRAALGRHPLRGRQGVAGAARAHAVQHVVAVAVTHRFAHDLQLVLLFQRAVEHVADRAREHADRRRQDAAGDYQRGQRIDVDRPCPIRKRQARVQRSQDEHIAEQLGEEQPGLRGHQRRILVLGRPAAAPPPRGIDPAVLAGACAATGQPAHRKPGQQHCDELERGLQEVGQQHRRLRGQRRGEAHQDVDRAGDHRGKGGALLAAGHHRAANRPPGDHRHHANHSMALTMSSTTFFASPNTIIVLSM